MSRSPSHSAPLSSYSCHLGRKENWLFPFLLVFCPTTASLGSLPWWPSTVSYFSVFLLWPLSNLTYPSCGCCAMQPVTLSAEHSFSALLTRKQNRLLGKVSIIVLRQTVDRILTFWSKIGGWRGLMLFWRTKCQHWLWFLQSWWLSCWLSSFLLFFLVLLLSILFSLLVSRYSWHFCCWWEVILEILQCKDYKDDFKI